MSSFMLGIGLFGCFVSLQFNDIIWVVIQIHVFLETGSFTYKLN